MVSIALLIWNLTLPVCHSYSIKPTNHFNTLFAIAQYNTLCTINILRAWVVDWRLTQAFAMANVIGANHCPDA